MKKRLQKGLVASAVLALTAGLLTPAQAATTVLIWADETRGPNLVKTLKDKSDWVAGVEIEVKSFSNFDALKAAIDAATATSGPDIVVGANDWVPTLAKNGKLAPITLTATQRAGFSSSQFYDLTYQKKLYGVPVDVNNVAMIYNTKLVTSAPKSFGDMVDYYKANKASKNLKAGLCVAGGGMSWGAHSIASALGADAYYFNADGRINKSKVFNPVVFGQNVKRYLIDGKKSNGFLPASDTGCKDNFLAGTVPFAIIGNWEWTDYTAKGFAMNLMPVPGVSSSQPGNAFGSVSGALLTTFAATRGREAAAKSVLTDFFASTAGQVAYQKYEKRPPAQKGAASSSSVTDGQKGFGASAATASIPQVGAILNGSGKSYWDSLPAYWTAVLVDGKDPVAEAKKLASIYRDNLRAAAGNI